MIVLVDTTVWVDFFAARSSPHVAALETLIILDFGYFGDALYFSSF